MFLMPLKAFVVASLFVGATATAAFTILSAYGIHSVEDMKGVASLQAFLFLIRGEEVVVNIANI